MKARAFLRTLPFGLPSAAGALLSIPALLFPAFWPLAPLSLAALFMDLMRAPSMLRAFLAAFLFSTVSAGAGIWWFFDTLPLDWLGVAGGAQEYFVLMAWGQVSLALGLVVGLAALPLRAVRASALLPLMLAVWWVGVEEAKMWAFALLTYAERSLMGPHFSATAFGYPLAENPYLLQMAEGGGLLFLNFAVALMGALVAFALLGVPRIRTGLIAVGLLLACLLAYPLLERTDGSASAPLPVALYASDFPLGVPREDRTEAYLSALRRVREAAPEAELVVLPEAFQLEPAFASDEERRAATLAALEGRDPVIASASHEANGHDFSLVLSFDQASGARLGSYSKMFLMPGGEYMPYLLEAAFKVAADAGFTRHEKTLAARAMPGDKVGAVYFADRTFAGLVCSDVLSPVLGAEARALGADVIVNSANPAWFHDSRTLYEKTLQIAKVQAVAARAYYLYAANGSPSFAIDPQGAVIAETPWGFTGAVRVQLR